ncbi:AtpZ/AtpI family protein [soil metagenome]
MQDDPFGDRMKRLEERIAAAQAGKAEKPRSRSKMEASALGWRMVTELVAGMLIGLAIGWGIDSLLGTRPVFLVVFALLGFAAGVRVMMRTAGEVNRDRRAGPDRTGSNRAGPSRAAAEPDRAEAENAGNGRTRD